MAIGTPAALDIPGFINRPALASFRRGNIGTVTTFAGANDGVWMPLEPYPCAQVSIANMSGVAIQYARVSDNYTNYLVINNGITQLIQGLNKASDIAIRRNDYNGGQASVTIGYEALS